MPTTTPLTDAINALTTYANETTGASDTTLSDAVATLVAGYGQGGGLDYDTICKRSYTGNVVTSADEIKSYTFESSQITSATGNSVTDISFSAFRNCASLVSADFSNVTNIEEYAFNSCSNLVTINAPNLGWIGQQAFNGCKKLQYVDFPNLTNFNGNYVFHSCEGIIGDLFFPKANASTNLSYFARYATMENVVLPSMTAIVNSNTFRNCTNLKRFDSATNQIGNNNNFDNSKLDTMILRRVDNICVLAGTNNFSGTPFASNGTGGTIYVPSALLSTYESASNWSTIIGYPNNQILPIEGSYYETHYANGTPLPMYVEVTGFGKIDNKSLNDTGGIGSNNSSFITDFIETDGCLDWIFVCSANYNGNYCYYQSFNGDTFISRKSSRDNPKRIVDGVTLNAWRIRLREGATKFRFSGTKANIDAQPFHLYKEIWS